MALLNGVRHFRRNTDGISLYFNLDEWPIDVPLPPASSLVGFGESHEALLYPEWRLALEPERTVDIVTGLFKTPGSLHDVITWYQTELNKQGWALSNEQSALNIEKPNLIFLRPNTEDRVTIRLRHRPALQDTESMIWRVLKHPHNPAIELQSALPDIPATLEETK